MDAIDESDDMPICEDAACPYFFQQVGCVPGRSCAMADEVRRRVGAIYADDGIEERFLALLPGTFSRQ